MYQDAFEVLYTKNVFGAEDPAAMTSFLDKIPTAALKLIRNLTFCFEENDFFWGPQPHPLGKEIRRDWPDLCLAISQKLNLANLFICLDLDGVAKTCEDKCFDDLNVITLTYQFLCSHVTPLIEEMKPLGEKGLKDLSGRMSHMTNVEMVYEHRVLQSRWVDRRGRWETLKEMRSILGSRGWSDDFPIQDGDLKIALQCVRNVPVSKVMTTRSLYRHR